MAHFKEEKVAKYDDSEIIPDNNSTAAYEMIVSGIHEFCDRLNVATIVLHYRHWIDGTTPRQTPRVIVNRVDLQDRLDIVFDAGDGFQYPSPMVTCLYGYYRFAFTTYAELKSALRLALAVDYTNH